MKFTTLVKLLPLYLAAMQLANAFALEPRDCCHSVGGGNAPDQVCAGKSRTNAILIRVDGTETTPCCGKGSIYHQDRSGTDCCRM